jgi:hypothetical protein
VLKRWRSSAARKATLSRGGGTKPKDLSKGEVAGLRNGGGVITSPKENPALTQRKEWGMIKSALGKVMWVGRATVFLVGLAVILAVVVGLASTALAANGANFIIGNGLTDTAKNIATLPTRLTMQGTNSGPALQLTQQSTNTGAQGLGVTVPSGKAPITVNSAAGKATNLNADKIDSLDSTALQRRVSGTCAAGQSIRSIAALGTVSCETDDDSGAALRSELGTSDAGGPNEASDPVSYSKLKDIPADVVNRNADKVDNFNANELVRGASAMGGVNATTTPAAANLLSASAPGQGGLLINLDFACMSAQGTTDTRWDIDLRVDGASPLGVFGNAPLGFPHAALQSNPLDSTSVTAFVPVNAGNHTIGYNARRTAGDGSLDCNIFVSSLYVPFGNSGSAPTSTQALSQQTSEGGGAQR